MFSSSRRAGALSSVVMASLSLYAPIARAQTWLAPGVGDPARIACPDGPASGSGIDPTDAWKQGKALAQIEGDGPFGIGSLGHTPQALGWYCKASAAGNPVAAYDIADIFYDGYVVNSFMPNGRPVTVHHAADPRTAFYWYKLAADRGYTKGLIALSRYYALGGADDNSGVARDGVKAFRLLDLAATQGDTEAINYVLLIYQANAPGWLHDIPLPASFGAQDAGSYSATMNRALATGTRDCQRNVQELVNSLSDAARQRGGWLAVASGVRGDIELDCLLISGAPPSLRNRSTLEQLDWLTSGGAVDEWSFQLITMPGSESGTIVPQTTTQAMIEGMESMTKTMAAIRSAGRSPAP